MNLKPVFTLFVLLLLCPSCFAHPSRHTLRPSYVLSSRGIASWNDYGNSRLTTASRYYPCGSVLRVTNLDNGKSVVVTVNDFGPAKWTHRRLDLSTAAFRRIGRLGQGTVRVKYTLLRLGRCRIHRHTIKG